MKKATSLLVILAMFVSASCGSLLKDEEEVNTSLVGSWMASDQDGTMTINFNSSGTYNIESDCPESGTWTENGSSITFTATAIGGTYCGTVDGSSKTMTYSMANDGKSFIVFVPSDTTTKTYTFYRQ